MYKTIYHGLNPIQNIMSHFSCFIETIIPKPNHAILLFLKKKISRKPQYRLSHKRIFILKISKHVTHL